VYTISYRIRVIDKVEIKIQFLGKRYYVTFALCHHKSVCRLSVVCLSVMLLRPTHSHRVELFGNNFVPSTSLGTWTVCIKILGKKLKVNSGLSRKLSGRGYEKLAFVDQHMLYFENGKRRGHRKINKNL